MGRKAATGHADKILGAIDADGAARSALVASWRRSSQHGLDPTDRSPPQRLTDAELAAARQRMEPLIRAAQTSLNRLYQAVGGAGCSVLLADARGVPVERRGAAGDDEVFEDWGLWTGAVWSEASEGTNGIGTCLVEKRLLTIAPRPAFLQPQHAAELHHGADLRPRRARWPGRSTSRPAAPT